MRFYFYYLFPTTEKSHGHANSLVKYTHAGTLGLNMQTNGDGGPTETTWHNNLKEKVLKALAGPLIQQSLILLEGTNTLL